MLNFFRPAWRLSSALALFACCFSVPALAADYKVELGWSAIKHASAYVVQIATDPHFEHLVDKRKVAGNHFTWEVDTAGYYYWRVAAVDEEGDEGAFSEFKTITIDPRANVEGDEASYETFQRFDEYSKHQNRLALYFGGSYSSYYFSSSHPGSPDSVVLKAPSFLQGQIKYDFWLNPYYSGWFHMRVSKTPVGASNFEGRPSQEDLSQDESMFSLGIERRFFAPSYYLSIQLGIRVSYGEMPTRNQVFPAQLALTTFGFFGPYVRLGAHKELWRTLDSSIHVGFGYLNSGDSYRLLQTSDVELKYPIAERIKIGIALEQQLDAYRLNSTDLVGEGHALTFRPMALIEFIF